MVKEVSQEESGLFMAENKERIVTLFSKVHC